MTYKRSFHTYFPIHSSVRSFVIALTAAAMLITSVPAEKVFAAETTTTTTTPAANTVIHQKSVSETVVSGLTHETITRFTDDGWLNINVLKADLSSKYIKVDTMANSTSVQQLASLYDLARENKAVAAVNGGFFIWGTGNNINPIGPIVETGDVKTAYGDFNVPKEMFATFALDTANKPLASYWKMLISVTVNGTTKLTIGRYNKPYYGYTDLTVIDSKWSRYSIGASTGAPDMTEAVVSDGKVIEIRYAMPPVEIPVNGYIIATRREGVMTILQSLKVGDTVNLDITTQPDWKNLKMAVTGGAMLVKDGKAVTEFSHDIAGRHPRSAIGSSMDGRYLYMVTVDGRQEKSIGMTQSELAALMIELGAYNAVNLDGGGSTAMLSRPAGEASVSLANVPSDSFVRKVSNAVGIMAETPASSLRSLILRTEDNGPNVFVSTSRGLIVKGLDEYGNPVQVKPETVQWSVTGVSGSFRSSVFYPISYGEAKITAKCGTVTATIPISVLSSPVQLVLSAKELTMPLGTKKQLDVKGKNRNGYFANINPADVKWELKNVDGATASQETAGVGTISKGLFTAVKPGTVLIDASVGTTHAYCAVSSLSYITILKDSFEIGNGAFLGYPDTVKGSYGITTELKHNHSGSGKLTYDLSENTDKTRAAYLVFDNGGVKLNSNTVKFGLWVYTDHVTTSWLRAEIADVFGKKHLIDISKGMDWTGWKYIEASLEHVKSPALLTRLYMVQVDPIPDKGIVYFDDLTISECTCPPIDPAIIPPDTLPKDPADVAVKYVSSATSFRFAVFGDSRDASADIEKKLAASLADRINKYVDAAALVGLGTHNIAATIKKPLMATWTAYSAAGANGSSGSTLTGTPAGTTSTTVAYKAVDIKNSRLIQLDTGSGSIRTSSKGQWTWFIKQLDTFKGANVFIFMASHPDSCTDRYEAELFQDILTAYRQKTGRNIWVFYKSDRNLSYMHRGVKYLSTAGFDTLETAPGTTNTVSRFLLVTVNGSALTFQFKEL